VLGKEYWCKGTGPDEFPTLIETLIGPLHNLPRLPRLHLIDPSRDHNLLLEKTALFQKLHILLDRSFQISKCLEISFAAHELLQFFKRLCAEILLDQTSRSRCIEDEHATTCVLDKDNLSRSKELLRDDERAQGVDSVTTCVPDNVGIAERNAKGGCWINAGVHASYCTYSQRRALQNYVTLYLPTAYFFAGGSARWPCEKLAAYDAFFAVRFSWLEVCDVMFPMRLQVY
jgi:hypothetical protein